METNATRSSNGRMRWSLAPRSQRPWTYSVPWMRGADGGAAVVGSLSWQLLQTSAVHSIVGEQCSAGSATDSVSAGAKRRQRELRGSADINLAISTIA